MADHMNESEETPLSARGPRERALAYPWDDPINLEHKNGYRTWTNNLRRAHGPHTLCLT